MLICRSLPGNSTVLAIIDDVHQGLATADCLLAETHYMDYILLVHSHRAFLSVVQKIVSFFHVNFEQRHPDLYVDHPELFFQFEDVLSCEKIQSRDSRPLDLWIRAHHRESLPAACLPVSEASHVCALESGSDQRSDLLVIDLDESLLHEDY